MNSTFLLISFTQVVSDRTVGVFDPRRFWDLFFIRFYFLLAIFILNLLIVYLSFKLFQIILRVNGVKHAIKLQARKRRGGDRQLDALRARPRRILA